MDVIRYSQTGIAFRVWLFAIALVSLNAAAAESFFGEELLLPEGHARARLAVVEMNKVLAARLMLKDDRHVDYWDTHLPALRASGDLKVVRTVLLEGNAEQMLVNEAQKDDALIVKLAVEKDDLNDTSAQTEWDIDCHGTLLREHERLLPWSHTSLLAAQTIPQTEKVEMLFVRLEGGLHTTMGNLRVGNSSFWLLSLPREEFFSWQLLRDGFQDDAATFQAWMQRLGDGSGVELDAVAACGAQAIVAKDRPNRLVNHLEFSEPTVMWNATHAGSDECNVSVAPKDDQPEILRGWLAADGKAKFIVTRRLSADLRANPAKQDALADEAMWKIETPATPAWRELATSLSDATRVGLAELLLATCKQGEAKLLDAVHSVVSFRHLSDESTQVYGSDVREWSVDWQADGRLVSHSWKSGRVIESVLFPACGADSTPEVIGITETAKTIEWWVVRHTPTTAQPSSRRKSPVPNLNLHLKWSDGKHWVLPVSDEVESHCSRDSRSVSISGGEVALRMNEMGSTVPLPATSDFHTIVLGDGLRVEVSLH